MFASGCTIYPPIVFIFVRSGWTMGGMKKRYLKRKNMGDRFVGRCIRCLNKLEKDFAASCPYFDFAHSPDELERVRLKDIILLWLKARV